MTSRIRFLEGGKTNLSIVMFLTFSPARTQSIVYRTLIEFTMLPTFLTCWSSPPAQRTSPGSPRGCWPRPGPRRTRPRPRRRLASGSGRTARDGAREMASRLVSIVIPPVPFTPLGAPWLIPMQHPFELHLCSGGMILTLLEGAESENTEDILGAGYWAQQPVWDTARSASSQHCHHHWHHLSSPVLLRPLASIVVCRNV